MIGMKRSLTISLILFFCISCVAQKDTGRIQEKIKELMEKSEGIGLSVAVVKDNRICYLKTFGYNPDYDHPERRCPLRTDAIFRIASISKTFVATAIMQLVEKGKIGLDDDISSLLGFSVRNPYFPQVPITVRMLLGHRSSITDYQYGTFRNSIAMFNSANGIDQKPFFEKSRPGTKYKYSNYGYSLLGVLIEKVSQQRFDRYISENIMHPLGLAGSYNMADVDSTKIVWAFSYNSQKKSFAKSPQMYKSLRKELESYKLGECAALFSPAGGMMLSIGDLATYMMMHMNYGEYNGVRILKKESEERLWKVYPGTKYGFGFQHASFGLKSADFIGHQGGAYGIHSAMFFNPKDKYGFVIICNGCNSGHDLDTEVLKLLYNSFF